MEKLKNLFSKITSPVKETFGKFPITISIVYVLTIFIAVFMDTEVFKLEIVPHIFFIGVLWALGSLLVESLNKKDKASKILGLILTFGISFFWDFLLYQDYFEEILVERIFFVYIISLILFTVYKIIQKSEVDFKEYILKVASSIFQISIVYLIFNIGIAFLTISFSILLLDGEHLFIVFRLLTLLFGLFYIPAILHSLTNVKNEISKFIKNLVLYVLLPLVFCAVFIYALYIIKIIIEGNLPEYSIFGMLSVIFVIAFPVCIMARNYKEYKAVNIITKMIMFAYIPFIILQVYAMNLRVSDYGLTVSRYFAYWFVIFECFTLFFSVFKDSKYIENLLLILIAIIVVTFITPLNYENIVVSSQAKVLDELVSNNKSFEGYSEDKKSKFASAYEYIEKFDSGEEYIDNNFTKKEQEQIQNYNGYYYTEYESETEYLYFYTTIDGLDISNYSKIYNLSNKDDDSIDKFVEKLIELNEEDGNSMRAKTYFKSNSLIECEDYDIFLEDVDITYNTKTLEVEYFDYNGYRLEK